MQNLPFDSPRIKAAIDEVRGWLDLKTRTGRYSHGFSIELAIHLIVRSYDVHAIYDEVAKLEGHDTRPSVTKPATPFLRPPLVGLWHKHHPQAQFWPLNVKNEIQRPGVLKSLLVPYEGRYLDEVAEELTNKIANEVYPRRSAEGRMTGEFIVYEILPDGSNYYLTLGSHGEWASIRSRVDAYKFIDEAAVKIPK